MSVPGASRRIVARAPVRLDFAGGWTDVPPYSREEGGVVVNAALALHATAELVPRDAGPTLLVAEDLDAALEVHGPADLAPGGGLELVKAALRRFPPPWPATLTTRSGAPPGSGLGSSGAMDVALVAALAAARGEPLDPHALAERGWRLETEDAGIAGGKQDQWAAALGGIRRLVFRDPLVETEVLPLDAEFAGVLARSTVLCYTGRSRLSGAAIARVVRGYERGDPVIRGAFHAMRDCAEAMAEALRAADLARVGALLAANWREQQRLDSGMRTDDMARLEAAAAAAGALGGKAAGAGAGGSMFFLAPDERSAARVAAAARAAGSTILPVAWAGGGVQVATDGGD